MNLRLRFTPPQRPVCNRQAQSPQRKPARGQGGLPSSSAPLLLCCRAASSAPAWRQTGLCGETLSPWCRSERSKRDIWAASFQRGGLFYIHFSIDKRGYFVYLYHKAMENTKKGFFLRDFSVIVRLRLTTKSPGLRGADSRLRIHDGARSWEEKTHL